MRVGMLVLLMALSGFSVRAADNCKAEVQNIGKKLADGKAFTQWRISHDAGSTPRMVYFKYIIHYREEIGTSSYRGVFRQMVRTGQYTKEDNLSHPKRRPTEIISVDFEDVTCSIL
jgi:hypothetical protein